MRQEEIRRIVREELKIIEDDKRYKQTSPLPGISENFFTHPPNHGDPWISSEKSQLTKEVRAFIKRTSIIHGRSFGSVAIKIRDMHLLFMPEEE